MTWQPIETAPVNTDVLVVYKDLYYQKRITIACYWSERSLIASDDYWYKDEYDEEKDCYYCSEGWYFASETTEESYIAMWTTPIHWMPLPVLPGVEH